MKALRPLAACALAGLGACSLPRVYGDTVDLQTLFTGGYRTVQQDDFDGHASYAVTIATRDPDNGWGYELGASYGAEEEGSGAALHEAEFDEYSFGLRRTFGDEEGTTRTYVGFGGAFTRLEHTIHSPTREFTDEGGGAYACAGVLWDMGRFGFETGPEVLVGVDIRALTGQDYDYQQIGLTLGFGK